MLHQKMVCCSMSFLEDERTRWPFNSITPLYVCIHNTSIIHVLHQIRIQLQLYTLESISGFERTVSLSQEITLRQWHDVKIIEQGERISITLDGNLTLQESLTLPNPLRTTSPLYIGGLPSETQLMYYLMNHIIHSRVLY